MRALLAAIALTLIGVGANAWLLRHDIGTALLTPAPARVAQNAIGALAARRPSIAAKLVAEDAGRDLSADRLAALADDLRARHGAFRFARAEERRDEHTARVDVWLDTRKGGEIARVVRLSRDPRTKLWKIVSLREAAGPRRTIAVARARIAP